jgi:uncharacterized membrane protein
MKEMHIRSIVKAISWRLVATATTVLLVWMFTGDLTLSFSVGALELISKLLLYYLHERAWILIRWGKKKAV